MSQVYNKVKIGFESTITINQDEMAALDALVGYGDDAFIKAFKEKLGEAYIRKHEAGLKSFFKNVREQVLPPLADVEQARRDLHDAHKKREKRRLKAQAK